MSAFINPDSALAREFWEKGKLESCPVYDFHGHMHEMFGGWLPAGEPEQMLETMDLAGVRRFCFSSHLALYCAEAGERANLEPIRRLGGPLRAYLGVQGFAPNPERDIAALKANRDIYVGCKFLCDYHHVAMEGESLAPYWEFLNENHLLALCHTWGGSRFNGVENVRAVAEKYPNVTIVVGHSCHGQWAEAIRLAQDFPNVYLELTAVLDDRGILDRFVREVGSHRILFGTDLPWFSTHHGIGCILDAEMTDDDRHNILHRNGEAIFARLEARGWGQGVK